MRAHPCRSALALLWLACLPVLPRAAEADLEAGFQQPPTTARPLVWWHWINGNVTKEGIEADLADMKRVGIGGVQMFDVSIYLPPGPIRYGTDAWHEHVQHAIRTADRLGLEFHLMNTPGWSASGGPWVDVERSMKQLVWTQLDVEGGDPRDVVLPAAWHRLGFYRDAVVLAVPADTDAPRLTARVPGLTDAAALTDGDPATTVTLAAGTAADQVVDLTPAGSRTVSQLAITLAGADSGRVTWRGSVEGTTDGQAYAKLQDFHLVDHDGPPPQVIVNVRPARYRGLRLRLNVQRHGRRIPVTIGEIAAAGDARLTGWTDQIKQSESSVRRQPASGTALATHGAIPPAQVIRLDSAVDPATSRVRCTLPPGRWTLLRFGFTSTGSMNHPAVPEGHGLEIDKLDADAVAFYFERALGRILREAGPLAGRTLKGLLFDSFEGGPQNWTATFPEQFQRLKGYDFTPFLPALTGRIVGSPALTEAALHDFRSAVEELIARNYFGTMRRLAHAHGLIIHAEAQGGPLNPVVSAEHVDVPMNEFWLPETEPRAPRIKLVASAAAWNGRPIVAAEAFTAKPEDGAWQAVPSQLKNPGDYAWTTGINRFILHHYTHQPFTAAAPGFGLGRYGTHFGRLNSWWPLADAWVSYVARGQFLLQQGRTVADVAFLQNGDHGYAYPAGMVNLPAGHDYEIIYPRHLAQLRWQDGEFISERGPRYRVLVLPENWAAEIGTLRHLRNLVADGARVIGPAPVSPAGVQDFAAEAEFRRLCRELWPEAGRGRILDRANLATALRTLGLEPDVTFPAVGKGDLRHVHRRLGDTEVYFVFNHSAEPVTGLFSFRASGRIPELWDAVRGEAAEAAAYQPRGDRTTLPLHLEAYGSRFVVFRRPLPARWVEATTPVGAAAAGRLLASRNSTVELRYSDGNVSPVTIGDLPADRELGGPWDVAFPDGRGAPPSARFPRLISWPEHPDDGIRHYAGLAHYATSFEVAAADLQARAVSWLDLGRVADLAEVTLNGERLGVVWQPPFRLDVSRHLRTGRNTLEVRVANRWINRLIGDERIPVDYTYQKPGTNKFTDGKLERLPDWLWDRSKLPGRRRVSFATWKHYRADSPLVPSGLLGPVRLEWAAAILP